MYAKLKIISESKTDNIQVMILHYYLQDEMENIAFLK